VPGAPGAPGTPGDTGTDAEAGWETGVPGGAGEGWETSNQIPGVGTNPIPPMPSERGLPPGSGEAGGAGTAADAELDKALEDFDGGILAARDVIRTRSNETAGGVPASSLPGGSPGAQGGTSESGAPGTPGTSEPVFGSPHGLPSERSAPPVAGPTDRVPEDIPDAQDDDIIARQLREAAMNEPDPELREKLWEEYRRYKGA